MKRLLLTTAAVVALFAAPAAIAQNTSTSPVYTQTKPTVEPSRAVDGEAMRAPTTTAPTMSDTTRTPETMPTADTMATPESTATPDMMPMQSTAQREANSYGDDDAQEANASPERTGPSNVEYNASPTSAADAGAQYATRYQPTANTMIEPARLQEAALEAGMAGTPMNASDVCAIREIDLGSSRLTSETRQQLRFAVDRASACEIDRIVISAPSGREQAVRQVLIDQGVDAADIEMQEASELGVEMRFAGIATSSAYYASVFSPNQQLALNDTAAAASGYASPDAGLARDEVTIQPDDSALDTQTPQGQD